jgi:hypothetical protein
METKKTRTGFSVFIIISITFIAAGIAGGNAAFLTIGIAFLAIGIAGLKKSGHKQSGNIEK